MVNLPQGSFCEATVDLTTHPKWTGEYKSLLESTSAVIKLKGIFVIRIPNKEKKKPLAISLSYLI